MRAGAIPRFLRAFAFGAFALGPSLSRAGAFEVAGLGPAGVAEVGARAARADDGTAAFFNPGGLALGVGTTLSVSPLASYSALRAQGERLPLEDPFGLSFTAGGTVPFSGPLAGRIRVAFAGHFMPSGALRLLAREPEKPFFPYYDNRTQRLVVLPALGVRITKALGLGVGANVLAGVRGPARLEDGATGAPEPRIDIVANTVVAGIFGARFDPTEHARLALVVRQSFGIPLQIETTANIGGVPLATSIASRQAMFDPLTVVAASSFDVGKASLELDASYQRFSAWEGPFLAVRSTLPGVNLASRKTTGLFRDTVALRLAGTYDLDLGPSSSLVLRAGAGVEPTMLKSALQGRTNLVDGDKLSLGLGATFVLKGVVGKVVRVGFGGNTQILSSYTEEKVVCRAAPCSATTVTGPDATDPAANIKNPGYPTLTASGSFFTFSAGLGVDL